jgi:hypothetical protein
LDYNALNSHQIAEVANVADPAHRNVGRLLDRRYLGPETIPEEAASLQRHQPLLA